MAQSSGCLIVKNLFISTFVIIYYYTGEEDDMSDKVIIYGKAG